MLKQRVITGFSVLIPLLAAIFFLPPNLISVLLAAMVLGGAWEWAGFLAPSTTLKRALFTLATLVAMLVVWFVLPAAEPLEPLLWVAVSWWLLALVLVVRYPASYPQALIVICGLIVLVPAWVILVRVHASESLGPAWLLFVFAVVWAADTGAYFVGKAFGHSRLAPKVSPGKTWEGVGGGLALAGVVAAVGAWLFGVPIVPFVGICIATALVSIVGDLTVSMFKRHAGVKDSGTLFPGHGGILDRIDSITAAAPIFALGIAWLGLKV
ncbi:MAG: phosphatidate cytidylyltransferase [Pseudomonadota bacterium]